MQQRYVGGHRPEGLAPGSRHDDLGPRHRRARGPRPAGRVLRRRRHAARHGARLRRRRLRGARSARCSARSWRATRWCWRPRPASGVRRKERVFDTSRGYLLQSLDTSLKRLGVDHVDLWQVHVWVDDDPARGDAQRPRPRGQQRPRVVRRRHQLHRLADRPGRHLAAGGARPGRRSPPTRSSTPCSTARVEAEVVPAAAALGLGILPWSPLGRGVLTGKYRTGTPADSRAASAALSRLRRAAAHRAQPQHRRGRRPRRRRARAGPRSRWRWPGCATGPGVTAPIVGARTAAQLKGSLSVEECELPTEIIAALDDVSGDAARERP